MSEVLPLDRSEQIEGEILAPDYPSDTTAATNYLSANVNVATARLPVNYQQATQALTACSRVDECREWVNKTEAVAAYARMADDETLHKTAIRIKSRAIKRCGELLKQFKAPGARTEKHRAGADPRSQTEVGRDAGMSPRQVKDAVRVSNVPKAEFERLVESNDPPSVTELAELGKVSGLRSRRPSRRSPRASPRRRSSSARSTSSPRSATPTRPT